jgi:hypothetical protein
MPAGLGSVDDRACRSGTLAERGAGEPSLLSVLVLFRQRRQVMIPEQQQLISELSRNLVAEISPAELPLFRYQSDAFFQSGGTDPVVPEGKEALLGFGTGEAVTLITPYVLPVVTEVVVYMTGVLKESLKSEAGPVVNNLVRGLFGKLQSGGRKSDPPEEVPAAEPEPAPAAAETPAPPALTASMPVEGVTTRPDPSAGAGHTFTPEEIWQIAVEKGRKIHMKKADAERLADSIVAGLVLSEDPSG